MWRNLLRALLVAGTHFDPALSQVGSEECINAQETTRMLFVGKGLCTRHEPFDSPPRWGQRQFRPHIYTYAEWCVRVDELAKSRKAPTQQQTPLFFVF